MYLKTKEQLAVLQIVCDQLCSIGQVASRESLDREFAKHGIDGADEILTQLECENMVRFEEYKGKPHVGLTDMAVKVDDLNTMHLF